MTRDELILAIKMVARYCGTYLTLAQAEAEADATLAQ